MKYNKYTLNQKNKNSVVSDWAYKEGVFLTPQGDYIARVRKKIKTGLYTLATLSKHKTKEEAEEAVKEFYKNHQKLKTT